MSKCNPERKWSLNCIKSWEDKEFYENLLYYKTKALSMAWITELDDCSSKMYAEEYLYASDYISGDGDDDFDDSSDFAGILGLMLLHLFA